MKLLKKWVCAASFLFASSGMGAEFIFYNQFRNQDVISRVSTPNGMTNQTNQVQAPDFGPFFSEFTLDAKKGSGFATTTVHQNSTIESRRLVFRLAASGAANVSPLGSDTGITFDHNTFVVAFRPSTSSALLIEGVRTMATSGGAMAVNAVQMLKNAAQFFYVPNGSGPIGFVVPVEAGANYSFSAGADVSGMASGSNPSLSASCSSDIVAELGTTVPTSFVQLIGTIAGSAAAASYNDGVMVTSQCDGLSPIGAFQVSGVAAAASPTEFTLRWKSSSTHSAVIEVVRMLDRVSGQFEVVAVRSATPGMTVNSVPLPSPARWVGAWGHVSTQFFWLPTADIDSADGWSNALDFIRWTTH